MGEQPEAGAIHQREAALHDRWAAETRLADVDVRAAFEAPTAPENRFILAQMGPLPGKRILDLGAGLGESSVYFALQGASVTTVDISPGMVELALALAAAHGVELTGIVGAAESLNVPDERFDFVYAANLLHHVDDRRRLLAQVHAALKPGGTFFSWDPLGYNPVINVYRRMATQVRTESERPLEVADLRLVRAQFGAVRCRQFWLLSLVIFLKYFLVDRLHPNSVRYWKRILGEPRSALWWFVPLQRLDGLLTRVPLLRWWAWNVVIQATKA